MPSVKVAWTTRIIEQSNTLLYQVETVCSEPVDIPDAALFLVTSEGDYLNTCSLADYLYYYSFDGAKRIFLESALTNLTSEYIGNIVEDLATGETGILRNFHPDKTSLVVEAPNATFQYPGQLRIQHSTDPLTANFVFRINLTAKRITQVTRNFTEVEQAVKSIEIQRSRIVALLSAWKDNYGSFETQIVEVINA